MRDALTAALEISAIGITIVFASLVLVSLALTLINRLLRPRETAAPATDAAGPSIPADIVVVLAAAATTALGRRVRVAHVRYHSAAPDTEWSHQGRISVMGSHRVRH